jgi:Ca2+-transporting ATPase
MDTLAVLALCLDPPSADTMKRKPIGRTEPFITRTMWTNILAMSSFFTVALLVLQVTNFLGADRDVPRQFTAVIFTTYVFFQVFNEFNCRSLDPMRSPFAGLIRSRNFLGVMVVMVVVQVMLTQLGGEVFNTSPLPLDMWLKIIALTSTALLIPQTIRIIRKQLASRTSAKSALYASSSSAQ